MILQELNPINHVHGVNTRKYWLIEVIENGCIVTGVRVYDEILPEPSGNPSLYCQSGQIRKIQKNHNLTFLVICLHISLKVV